MFRNYLKIAFRHISRNKSYVFINVMGLGIAMACSMVAFVNYQDGINVDKFHENYNKIYRVLATGQAYPQATANISSPLVARAAEEISGIDAGVRFYRRGVIIQNGEDVFAEGLYYADPDFFEVFSYEMIEGNANALKDPSKIFITDKRAEKYFGTTDVIEESLTINPGEDYGKTFTIGGVIKDISAQSSCLQFHFLTNIAYLEKDSKTKFLDDWNSRVDAAFLLLKNPSDKDQIAQQLDKYIPIQNKESKWDKRNSYLLQPMSEVFLKGSKVSNNNLATAASSSFYWGPALLAIMILLTASLNFTNTTISFSNKRLKEMGVRKVMGGGRTQLMFQLLGESLVICILAAGVAVILSEYLVPLYNNMWSTMSLELKLDYFNNPNLLLFIGGIVLLTTLLGGAYAAFYISSFKPSHIFRGNTKFGGDNWFIRSLLGLQIVISLVAIIGGVTFSQNADFQQKFDLGYNINGVINVEIRDAATFKTFKNIISANPDILQVAGAQSNLGFHTGDNKVGNPEDNRFADNHLIGADFLKAMNLKVVAGRDFDESRETDFEESVLVTQKFVKESQWDNPIGQKVKHYYPHEKTVIGVVEDFYARSFYRNPAAGVFHFVKPERYRVMKIQVPMNKLISTKKYLNETWTANFPYVPFDGYFQDRALVTSQLINKNVANIGMIKNR